MMDVIHRVDVNNKVDYVWFDTGIEYQATKDHLKYLEERYCVDIKRVKAIKPIPLSCKEYGQPFFNKKVSQMLYRMQMHEFNFEEDGNKSFEELMEKYDNLQAGLKWWCNRNISRVFNIGVDKYLKEFIIANPPWFKISDKCCEYAKKNVAHKYIKNNNYICDIVGVRKAEGGQRSVAYKNCYTERIDGCSDYRPLFWWKNSDKEEYEKLYHIVHSGCYTKYGMLRTGCAGCPFGRRNFEERIETIKHYEPKLYVAINNIFKDSYEYTRMFNEFREKMKLENK